MEKENGDAVAVVTVNYNAKLHVAHLLYSLHQTVIGDLAEVVVVDNGSTDGSRELLAAATESGLCVSIFNTTNRYHGPALNQGVAHVVAHRPEVQWVWLLDSDCVVLDTAVVSKVMGLAADEQADVVGEEVWDAWNQLTRLGLYSLMASVSTLRASEEFEESGDPSFAFEASVRANSRRIATFPFTREGHIIHVGRGTLREVWERRETSNRYSSWAEGHNEPHFQGVGEAAERYRLFCQSFANEIPDVTPEAFVRRLTTQGGA